MLRTIVVRQHGQTLWASTTNDTSIEVTDTDRRLATECLRTVPTIRTGYYDLLVRCNGRVTDESIEIN